MPTYMQLSPFFKHKQSQKQGLVCKYKRSKKFDGSFKLRLCAKKQKVTQTTIDAGKFSIFTCLWH